MFPAENIDLCSVGFQVSDQDYQDVLESGVHSVEVKVRREGDHAEHKLYSKKKKFVLEAGREITEYSTSRSEQLLMIMNGITSDEKLDWLIIAIRNKKKQLIVGPPGAGKTTSKSANYSVRVTSPEINKDWGTVNKVSFCSADDGNFIESAKGTHFVVPNLSFHRAGSFTFRVEVLDGARSLLTASFDIEVRDVMQCLLPMRALQNALMRTCLGCRIF
jgi:hypothetical protein